MPTIDSNVVAFQQHFSVFDTAAKGGNADGKVSRKDIEAVANGAQYTPEQRAAAQHILDNPETYALLDTGRDGGGFGADGVISRQDVDAVMERAPLFEDTAAFTSDGVVVAQDSTHGLDDPMSAAAQTQMNGDGSATLFMQFVHAHGDDPQWLQGYFNALGAEQTAAYLSTVADPGRYTDLSADYAEGEIEAIRGALEGMYESGALNGSDIARLVEHWAMDRGDFSPGVAQLFGGLGGPRAEDMKNDFFRAAGELALAGQEVDNREFEFSDAAAGRLTTGDRESLAAAAAFVLAQTGAENQVSRMIDLQADGGVDRFISLAMGATPLAASFDSYTSDAAAQRMQDPDSRGIIGQEVDYDGVAQLVSTLSFDTAHFSGPGNQPPAPYSHAALQSVRDDVFYAASNGLDANRDQWQDNTLLKDGLSRIFMADFDRMLGEATTGNGARLDDDHPFPEALENFAQNVLFTDPTGDLRNQTSEFLVDRLGTMVEDVNTLDDAAFAAKYDGANQAQVAHIAGSLLGHIDNGLEQAVDVAKDRNAAQQKGLEFGLDLAWSLGQDGLKLLPGGNVISAILPDSVTKSATWGEIKGEVEKLMKQGLTSEASELLLEKFPDLHADGTLSGLMQELSEEISVDNDRDYLAALLSSYNTVDASPAATN